MSHVIVDKRTRLFIILAGIFLTNALLAEVVGVKIFSAEAVFGFEPAQLKFFGQTYSFNLTAGVVLWPVVFITTDIINEYFGKKGVRFISYLTAGLIGFAFLAIFLATLLPPSPGWLGFYPTDDSGNPFNIDFAFKTVFTQGLGIIIGSLFAFLLGQLVDVFVFQRLRRITGARMIWLRATVSTLVSQLLDSFVVLLIAFYVFGPWPLSQVVAIGIVNYIYKFTVAVVLTPTLYIAHGAIDRFLGKELSEQMQEEASQDTSFL